MAEKENSFSLNKALGFVFGGGIFDKTLKTKWLPTIAIAVLLLVLYITNGYHAYYTNKQNKQLDKEIRELRAESIATQTELITKKKHTNILDQIKESGLELEESKTPPYSISLKSSGK